MKLRLNDQVEVIAGKDKGKRGKITRIYVKQNKIVVEGVNMRTKHIKKTAQKKGEIIKYEAPVDASNVMLICPKTSKRTRVGYKREADGTKVRIAKISKEILDDKKVSKKK